MPQVSLTFSPPNHGWLPTRLTVGTHTEEFSASKVPRDPIPDLCSAILNAAHGREGRVTWHLEPEGIALTLSPEGSGVLAQLHYVEDAFKVRGEPRLLATVSGTKQEILGPLVAAVRELSQMQFSGEDWDAVSTEELNSAILRAVV
jgi:hypothetical protein